MEKWSTERLEEILQEEISHREIIDDSKSYRVIEKIKVNNQNVFIKYGQHDNELKNEIFMYNKVFMGQKLPVPKALVAKHLTKDESFLALEWIEGIHPDMENTTHIEKVFSELGKWAGLWSNQIDLLSNLPKRELHNFSKLKVLVDQHHELLKKLFDHSLIEILEKCIDLSPIIIQNIEQYPLTLDPEDISLHNILLDEVGNVIFIDFEFCSVRPMSMMVEHLGSYTSVPYRKEDIKLALQVYVNAWNAHSNLFVQWEDFSFSQLCARIYYKIGNFSYWIQRLVEEENKEETIEWIQSGQLQLEELVNRIKNSEFLIKIDE